MNRGDIRFRKANPVPLSGIMVSVVGELRCEEDFFIDQLKKDWKDIVGETNARNIHPLSLQNGVLTASVSSPGWMTELQFAKKRLLDKINDYETIQNITVQDIRFILDVMR
jgi:hypothetical protein